MKTTALYLEEELVANLKEIAQREDRTESEVIRDGLVLYAARQRQGLPSFFGSVHDKSVRGADDEAWLEAHWRPD
jgi:predicted transcriptional regulator